MKAPLPPLHPARLLATWFGAGMLPLAPGTWGSLAALPLAYGIVRAGGRPALLLAIAIVVVAGLWATRKYLKTSPEVDPGPVVVDEVAGQWLVLLAVPADLLLYAAGFLLFRAVDILKPWPVGWVDEKIHGAVGVMLDDLLAAPYAAAALAIMAWLTGRF